MCIGYEIVMRYETVHLFIYFFLLCFFFYLILNFKYLLQIKPLFRIYDRGYFNKMLVLIINYFNLSIFKYNGI